MNNKAPKWFYNLITDREAENLSINEILDKIWLSRDKFIQQEAIIFKIAYRALEEIYGKGWGLDSYDSDAPGSAYVDIADKALKNIDKIWGIE